MKNLLYISLSFFVCLGQSCISDDLSSCPPVDNVAIRFDYPSFEANIKKVNIAIFDHTGKVVETSRVEENQLHSFQGYKTVLPKGQYTAICWGNVFDHTQLIGFEEGGDINNPDYMIRNDVYLPRELPENNDSLYYCRSSFTVKEKLDTAIRFVPAHIKLQFEVKGLENIPGPSDFSVAVHNLPLTTNFQNNEGAEKATYVLGLDYYPGATAAQATLNSLKFTPNDPLILELRDSKDNIIKTFDLQSLIQQSNINLDNDQTVTIPIKIQVYSINSATITLFNWKKVTTVTTI